MAVYVSSPSIFPQIVDGDVLAGTIDGVNRVFTTSDKFVMEFGGAQVMVHVNGVRQKLTDDYSVSESVPGLGFDTITFVVAPKPGDNLLADYEIFTV